MNWKIYLLDDSIGRHALLNSNGKSTGLIDELNQNAGSLGSSHTFSTGFSTASPTLDATSINTALNDTEGIWLIDLHIPHGKGVGPASSIVSHAGSAELDLAAAVLEKLTVKQRIFIVISSQHVANAPFNQAITRFQAKSLTFDSYTDIPGAAQHILALIVPELIYKRALDEAVAALNLQTFHAAANNGTPMAMFDRATPPFPHDVASWLDNYKVRPSNELGAIDLIVDQLMTAWQLDSTALNSFRAQNWDQDWRLPTAKAINGGAIHRSLIFALSPNQSDQNCTPFERKRICDRSMRAPQSHLGILGLQSLLAGAPERGFTFSKIGCWSNGGKNGLQLTLSARFQGCEGKTRFEEVLHGSWNPPVNAPNTSQLSHALKHVRDAFLTDGSTVNCAGGNLELLIRLQETNIG